MTDSDPLGINEAFEYYSELERRFRVVKKCYFYQRWLHKPIPKGKLAESRVFKVILWPFTEKERIAYQSIQKGYCSDRPLPLRLERALNKLNSNSPN